MKKRNHLYHGRKVVKRVSGKEKKYTLFVCTTAYLVPSTSTTHTNTTMRAIIDHRSQITPVLLL